MQPDVRRARNRRSPTSRRERRRTPLKRRARPEGRRHQPRRAADAPSRRRARDAAGAGGAIGPADGPGARRRHRRRAGHRTDGRISIEDVKAHAKRLVRRRRGAAAAAAAEPLPDFSRWGEIERQPMRAVRRKTAEHLSRRVATIPHVTQHDLADVTALEELRKKYAKQAEAAGGELTVTAIAVKVVAAALKVFPQFNASIDLAAEEIIYKKYVNIGVAVDTDRGLLVPVIRDADTKNIIQISVEIAQLVREGARAQDLARRDAGRLLQHLESRRHRRHVVHADRQCAGSRDPRHLARADGAGVQGRAVRAAADAAAVAVVRSPRRSTAPTASASCAGSSRRSSSRSCSRSKADTASVDEVMRTTKARRHDRRHPVLRAVRVFVAS